MLPVGCQGLEGEVKMLLLLVWEEGMVATTLVYLL